jgi:hypothetical protein
LLSLAGWHLTGAVLHAMAFMPLEARRGQRSCIACTIPGFTPMSPLISRSGEEFARTTGHSETCRRSQS